MDSSTSFPLRSFLCATLVTAGGLSAQLDWHFNPPKLIGARTRHAAAFDQARGLVVLFGGYDGSAHLQDTWLWDGDNWRPAGNTTTPPRRSQHAMAYDAARKVVVLFGGIGPAGVLGDTWLFDGTDWKKANPTTSPPARFAHAMAFDAARGRVVLFGGFDGRSFLDDHWEWDGTNWTKRTFQKKPSARAAHAMSYDPARKRVVLFGGSSGFSNYLDTWEFDGSAWTAAAPAASPPAREGHAMAYDPNLAKTVLFGGWNRRTPLRDFWSWNGTTWTQIALSGSYPAAREALTLTADTTRKRLVLFGGFGSSANLGDTWEWNGKTWSSFKGLTYPTPAANTGRLAFYDPATERIEYIGPTSNGRSAWLYFGQGVWKTLPSPVPSSTGHEISFFYNAKSNRVSAFTNYSSSYNYKDTLLEFTGTSWTSKWSSSSPFYGRREYGIAFDTKRGRLMVLGGYTRGNTRYYDNSRIPYEWTGVQWQGPSSSSSYFPPSSRYGMSLAFDPLHANLVTFSGRYYSSVYAETYTYDPVTQKWTSHSSPMTGRYRQRIWWNPLRQRVMLFGGMTYSSSLLADLWEWDGKSWTKVVTKTTPPGRAAYCVATDPKSGKTLVFGGYGGKTNTWDVWELYDPGIAKFRAFGSGCKGTAGVPVLEAAGVSRPWLGETFKTVTKNLPPVSGIVLVVLGFSKDKWAMGRLPADLSVIGMTGCKLYVSPDVLLPALNQGGTAPWSIALPNNTLLKGKSFFVQTLVFDPKANPKGMTASNAGEAIMGTRR